MFPSITAIPPEGAREYVLPSTFVVDAGNKVSPLGRIKPVWEGLKESRTVLEPMMMDGILVGRA